MYGYPTGNRTLTDTWGWILVEKMKDGQCSTLFLGLESVRVSDKNWNLSDMVISILKLKKT